MTTSIDGAVREISQKRRLELGSQLAKASIELHKMSIEAGQVASGWRAKISKQQKLVDQLSMAIEIGREQVDTSTGEFVRAPEGSEAQLQIPQPAKRGRPAKSETEDDEEEPGDDDDDQDTEEGWAPGPGTSTMHYFRAGQSLCGKHEYDDAFVLQEQPAEGDTVCKSCQKKA